MANGTNASAPYYSYEYYLDYLDLIPVDEKKLKAHKHSIVIAFWVSLAAFVVLLFLILLYMSWSGSPQMRNSPKHHQTCPWSHGLNLHLCIQKCLPCHREPLATSQAQASSVEPGSRTGPDQPLRQESSSTLPLGVFQTHPTLLWELTLNGGPLVRSKPSEPPPGDRTSQLQS
ncbi:Homo sapiens C21orf61 short form mRNA, variant 1 [Pan troglodytes]|uniref:Melanocortin-2 receptor accessory protein n=3 Tax=Pan TaxID=9596 RepID=MRAP_PANTR|nr:melanocortin-2 receptor accessory protein [Pan paniscus]Q68UT4.1 RecName: Full=Melanocortin-2 receptor accessory protein; AltName: Full=Fat cell-specific low molecular weight protein; AltName: Full=Fat tissue-specific low MW protein [Pan troglodytes]CAH18577.1 Homo sapiens C21orf61 short form mRNA, variant 1 [Pan troglodytes]